MVSSFKTNEFMLSIEELREMTNNRIPRPDGGSVDSEYTLVHICYTDSGDKTLRMYGTFVCSRRCSFRSDCPNLYLTEEEIENLKQQIVTQNMETLVTKTPQEWWDTIKGDKDKIVHWLKNQYYGEYTAAERIKTLVIDNLQEGTHKELATRIMNDEIKHAQWISTLLQARNITPEVLEKEERYWTAALEDAPAGDAEYAAGIAAHAEEMRLERIKIIMADETADQDIRTIFKAIYKDEVFHAKAFKEIAGDNYYNETSEKHAKGLEALGLII